MVYGVKMKQLDLEIVTGWMIRSDLNEVLRIEIGKDSLLTDIWSEEDFLINLREKNTIGMVCTEKGDLERSRILGYFIYEFKEGSFEILNFAVSEDCHRMRIGTQMIDKLKSKLSITRRTRLDFPVKETNLPGQLFLRANGFLATRVKRNYFEDRDAFLFSYNLEEQC